jgi:hypothetical protein
MTYFENTVAIILTVVVPIVAVFTPLHWLQLQNRNLGIVAGVLVFIAVNAIFLIATLVVFSGVLTSHGEWLGYWLYLILPVSAIAGALTARMLEREQFNQSN